MPGGQAIAKPEDIRRFARELQSFNERLDESISRLQGQFFLLSDTWRDQEHRKFAEEFEKTVRMLQHFRRAADEQIPFLIRKAQRLDEYLDQH